MPSSVVDEPEGALSIGPARLAPGTLTFSQHAEATALQLVSDIRVGPVASRILLRRRTRQDIGVLAFAACGSPCAACHHNRWLVEV